MGNTPSSHKISAQDRYGKPHDNPPLLILTIKPLQSYPRHEKPTRQAPPISATYHRNHIPRGRRSSRMPRTGRQIQSPARPPPKKVPGNPALENRRPIGDPRATYQQRRVCVGTERRCFWAAAGNEGAETDPCRNGRN